jgi:Tol biopolymer transport system component
MEIRFARPFLMSTRRPSAGAAAAILTLLLAPYAPTAAADPTIPRIAYSSFQGSSAPQIWLVNPDGTNPKRLTWHAAGGDGAAISPDGTQIAFESPRYGWANLFLVQTDGTGEHRLLGTNFYGQSASWSPDGTWLVFTHSSNTGAPGGIGTTWKVDAGGNGLTQISSSTTDDWMPCWSPDGTQIAFQSSVGGVWQIFVMNPDGSGRQQRSFGPGDKYGPRWSPDGFRFAYTLFPDPDVAASSIHVMHVDGTSDYALTDTTGVNGRPCWSPDGQRIAFHSNRCGNFRVFRIDLDRTDMTQVTAGASAPGDWGGDWRMVVVPPAAVGEQGQDAPLRLDMPNPARAGSVIRFSIGRQAATELLIYDTAGRLVRTLLTGTLSPGRHEATWDGRDDRCLDLPGGVYFCRIVSGGSDRILKLVYLR